MNKKIMSLVLAGLISISTNIDIFAIENGSLKYSKDVEISKEDSIRIESVNIQYKEVYEGMSTDISISIANSSDINKVELIYTHGNGVLYKNKETGLFEGKIQNISSALVEDYTTRLQNIFLYKENDEQPYLSINYWNYNDYGDNIEDFNIDVIYYMKDIQISKDKLLPGDIAEILVDMRDYKYEIENIKLLDYYNNWNSLDIDNVEDNLYKFKFIPSILSLSGDYMFNTIQVTHKDGNIHNIKVSPITTISVENDIRLHVVYPLKITVDQEKVKPGNKVNIVAKNVKEGINKVSLVYQSTNNGNEYPVTLSYNKNTGNYEGILEVHREHKTDLLAIKKVNLGDGYNEIDIYNRDLINSIGSLVKDFSSADIVIGKYENNKPEINANNKILYIGDRFNVLDGVTAIDKEDGNITNKIEVLENTVNISKIGVYKVIYKVTDNDGASITKEIIVEVKAKNTVQVPESPTIKFKDISGHWAETTIKDFINKDYVVGYNDGTFRPDDSITRGEFVKLLNRYFGLTNKSGKIFKDTATHWAKDEIDIAITNGVVNGFDDGTFRPGEHITREQAAKMVSNYLKIDDANHDKITTYTDGDRVSSWSKNAVEGVLEKGYMKGYNDNTFRPKNNITRSEAVVTLSRISK